MTEAAWGEARVKAAWRKMRAVAAGLALGLATFAALPATAQQFDAAITVDGIPITRYELSQRMAFLQLLNAPGDIQALASTQLINETLQLREAKKAGVTASEDDVKAGMEEFAQRANLTADELIGFLTQAGIAAETFRDFVSAGITWRDYVRQTVLPTVALSEADIDAAMAKATSSPGLKFLLSEIVLPAPDPQSRKASLARAKRLEGLDEEGFGDAAGRFSVGPSRNNKGKMNWLDLTALPPDVGAAVRGLKPGQMSRIIETDADVRLYFVRDREEVRDTTPRTMIDYMALLLPGGQSKANVDELAKIRARVVTCGDLYPIARALPPEQLVRETVAEGAVPTAYAGEIGRLDANEIGSTVTANGNMAVLMVCSRGNELPRSLTRAAVADQIKNQRVGSMAAVLLDQLRANADIVTR